MLVVFDIDKRFQIKDSVYPALKCSLCCYLGVSKLPTMCAKCGWKSIGWASLEFMEPLLRQYAFGWSSHKYHNAYGMNNHYTIL